MVNVTDRAKDVLLQKKTEANILNPEVGLRLTTHDTGEVALVVDRVREGDEIVMHRDATVLMVAPEVSAAVLRGRTIDCRETEDGRPQLVLAGVRATGRGSAASAG